MMTQNDAPTMAAIAKLADLGLPEERVSALTSAASPTQQMIRRMTQDVDLGETPPSSTFYAGWE